MKKTIIFFTICYLACITNTVLAQADLKPYIYLHSSEFPPYWESSNVFNRASMDTVFGADNWWEAYFETTPAAAIFNDTICMVYLEATGYYCASLENYLYTNYDLIHNWVANGGGLLLVCNPEPGCDTINLSFSNIKIAYPLPFLESPLKVLAVDTTNRVFQNPFYPVGSEWYLGCQAELTGDSLSPICLGGSLASIYEPIDTVIAELSYGNGLVVFGIAAPIEGTPQPYVTHLKWNLLVYTTLCLHSDDDLGVTNIIAPIDDCHLTDETITVKIRNFGYAPQTNFGVSFSVDGGIPVTELFTDTILPASVKNFTFTEQGNFSAYGNHTIKCYTTLANDTVVTINDTLIAQIFTISGIPSTVGFTDTVCYAAGILQAIPEYAGGVWSGDGIVDAYTGLFDPSLIAIDSAAIVSYTYPTPFNYTVFEIPYELAPYSVLTIVDYVAEIPVYQLPIGFTFCLFDSCYNSLFLAPSSYARLYFKSEGPFDYPINCDDPFSFMGITTLNFSSGYMLPSSGTIGYTTVGEAPNRKFILSVNGVPTWETPSKYHYLQIVLYESSNIIDVNYTDITNSPEETMYYLPRLGGDVCGDYIENIMPDAIFPKSYRIAPALCYETVTDTIHITNSKPYPLLQDAAFCFEDSILLSTAYVSSNYIWSNGDTTNAIMVADTGYYSLMAAYALGCFYTDSAYVSELDSLSLLLTSTPTLVGFNTGTATATIVSGGVPPFTYYWSDGQTTQTAVDLAHAIYGVTVTDAAGCSVYKTVTINTAVGIENIDSAPSFTIIPNPANSSFYFTTSQTNSTEKYRVNIYNLQGVLCFTTISSAASSINITTLPIGVYEVVILGENAQCVIPLVKE